MAEFFDSVWMNIFASTLILVYIIGNALLAGWMMGKTFDHHRTPLWFGAGLLLGVAGSFAAILALVAIWNDCPIGTCL